jgi:hypothetical protein
MPTQLIPAITNELKSHFLTAPDVCAIDECIQDIYSEWEREDRSVSPFITNMTLIDHKERPPVGIWNDRS